MTDEQKRIKIAEADGWRKMTAPRELGFGASAPDKCWYFVHQLPDYLNDLNAMHEAEKVLTGLTRHAYCDALLDTVPDSPDHLWEVLTATARQRAEHPARRAEHRR